MSARPVRVDLAGPPRVESFLTRHEDAVTLAEARWALLHDETLFCDRCVQGAEPAHELRETMLQQVVGEAAAVGAAGEG